MIIKIKIEEVVKMETKQAIEIMLKTAGAKKQDIAKFLNIAIPSFTLWLQKLNQIERLIKICKYCNCDIIITDHKNINIMLTSNNNEK